MTKEVSVERVERCGEVGTMITYLLAKKRFLTKKSEENKAYYEAIIVCLRDYQSYLLGEKE